MVSTHGTGGDDGGTVVPARGLVGGCLMGLANLVPGVSGGTMLLAVGIYPQFITAVAEVTTFRFRRRAVLLLAMVVLAASGAILLLAGALKGLVESHTWVMYSLFIGLTLGGVPLLWRMASPMGLRSAAAALVGIGAMVGLALVRPAGAGAGTSPGAAGMALLVLAGIAGGSAMILPGVSGAYLLLILGQYRTILGAIDDAGSAAAAGDWAALASQGAVLGPVALGVIVGVVGVSNIIKICLERFRAAALGVLLGLLLGAVIGLWPFQRPASAAEGPLDTMTFFRPTALEVLAAAALIGAGFAISYALTRLGGPSNRAHAD